MDFSFHKISIQDRKFSKFLSFPNLRPNLRPQDFKASVAEAEAEFSKSSAFGRSLRPSVDLCPWFQIPNGGPVKRRMLH